MTPPALINARDVARTLSIGVRHLYQMLAAGLVGPQPIRLGRSIRWRSDEINDWVRAGCPSRAKWEAKR